MSQPPSPDPVSQIQQDLKGDRNQAIGQVYGGIVVYVSGGQAIINPAQSGGLPPADIGSPSGEITANPYKGLLSFHEADSADFFGRSQEIQSLWEQFRHLQTAAIRLLPIYGPSGSGKSSLARAGLIPELGRRPLPGRDRARVAVLVPGDDPLYSLAMVLARISTNDPNPVEKADEFKRVLNKEDEGEFSGLKRIAYGLHEIATFPLIVTVDQFEEIYSYEPKGDGPDEVKKRQRFVTEREAFIKNLLYAASDRSQYVSVILTMRSDFLGETQKVPTLNRLFSSQGFLVPMMDENNLREAIAQPAKQAGHPLDGAIVNLLIEQSKEREGALPLLQFALTRIWEGLRQGETPAVTLEKIGGVGGALAGEAQRIYDSLSAADQAISRRVFLRLVQLGDVIKYTRRRAVITSLVSSLDTIEQIKQIIDRFASPGERLITLSAHTDEETVEITHEALFNHWQALRDWLEDNRLFLTWHDLLRATMRQWNMSDQDPEALLRGKPLAEAEDWLQKQEANLSQIEQAYIQASLAARARLQSDEQDRQQREHDLLKKFVNTAQAKTKLAMSVAGLAIAVLLVSGFAWQQQRQAQQAQQAFLLGIEPAKPELLKKLPRFLEEADRLRSTRKEENVQLALAYYRKILTDALALHQAIQSTPVQFQGQDEQIIKGIAEKAKNGLVETIRQARIPQLRAELNDRKFGDINGQMPPTDIENRFTEAPRTTAKILMSNFGAQADLNGNGQIDNKEEAERLPCEILKDIEDLWRQSTRQRCGWYGSTDKYLEPACGELDEKTLMTSIFVQPYSEIIKHLDSCPGILTKTSQSKPPKSGDPIQ